MSSSAAQHQNDKLWNALEAMSKQPEGESINKFLPQDKRETIKEKHLWVPVSSCMHIAIAINYTCVQVYTVNAEVMEIRIWQLGD